MSFRRRLFTTILTSLLTCSCIFAEDTVPSSVPGPTAKTTVPELTLQQCVDRALKKNFTLEVERYNPLIAKDAIDIAKGAYDPVVSATGFHGRSTTDAIGDQSSAGTTSSELRAGVTQQLYTGTTLTASSQLDRSKNNPAIYSINPAYNADLTLSVRQSLLSGFGTAVNKATLNRAKIGVTVANLNFKVQALDVIQNTEDAYYNLAFAREQLNVRNLSLELAQRLYDEAKTRRDTGVSTNLDVLQGEVGVANARRNVLLAEQQTKDSQDALLALIGQFELDTDVGAVHFKDEEEPVPVFASSYQMAKQNQPDYLASQATIDQLKLDVVVAKDATKPDLSVGGAVGLNGNRGSANDAFGDAFDRRGNSWQVDFAFSYPWGQVSEKARYRQSISTLSREQMRLRQVEQSIEVNVRSAVRSVETNHESVKIAALASDLSQKQYELEKARFDAGLSTSYLVLQAQNDLDTARVNELEAKVTLHTAIAALHRIEGSSLQRYGVSLP
ncbi:MAG TPA: TolC family protein [Lacunisphaera sp.]|jgi:outer membrane protein TolC